RRGWSYHRPNPITGPKQTEIRGGRPASPGIGDFQSLTERLEGVKRTPMRTHRLRALAALPLLLLALGTASARQSAETEAETLLKTARKAYADANFTFATEKFREFLTKFGS